MTSEVPVAQSARAQRPPANLPLFQTGDPLRVGFTAIRNTENRRTVRLLRSPR